MQEENIIKKDFRFPTEKSKKKRWYVTFKCITCNSTSEIVYAKSRFIGVCESCKKGKFTTEEFIKRAIKVHGDAYSYGKTEYKGKRTKVNITCSVHGDFLQRPSEHTDGHGCKKCGTAVRAKEQLIPIETWKDLLKGKAPHIHIVTEDSVGYHTKVDFMCEKHEVFTAQLSAIRNNKHICPECARLAIQKASCKKELYTPTNLYYVYLPEYNVYKLGISIYETTKRLKECTINIIWEIKDTHENIAKAEYHLHRYFKAYQYYGKKLIKNGNTELYTKNILPSEEELYKTLNLLNIKFNGALKE